MSNPQYSNRNLIAGGAVVLLIFALVVMSGDEEGQGSESASGESERTTAGSSEHFDRDSYGELSSNPDSYEGATVDVTGRVFTAPEREDGEVFFQMYADPANSGQNTLVRAPDFDVSRDDHVRVRGTVAGSLDGENLMGGSVSAVAVEAESVEVVDAVTAIDPARNTLEVGETRADQGFSLTLDRVELADDSTRAYLTARNDTAETARLRSSAAYILQGDRQIDRESPHHRMELEEPQREIQPGVETSGVVTFAPVDDEPFRLEVEWRSEDYRGIDPQPFVFEVAS